jgi:glycosyltransferase involved in cell wall biosynthesis
MKVSIIVPTYNRGEQLLFLLDALEEQNWKDFEVIIVNDGSTDHTINVLSEVEDRYSYPLVILHTPNGGRAVSRNRGAKAASGDLFIFYDDDVRPNRESVKAHVLFHQEMGSAILSGTCIYDEKLFTHDFQVYRKYVEEKWYHTASSNIPSKTLRVNGGNFSIPKALFEIVGGFDERLKDKEDFKLAFDANRKVNADVYFNFDAWVFHDDFKDLRQFVYRSICSRLEELKLGTLEQEIIRSFPERFTTRSNSTFKNLFFKLFRHRLVINFSNSKAFAKLFPKFIRFHVYDYICTANISYIDI